MRVEQSRRQGVDAVPAWTHALPELALLLLIVWVPGTATLRAAGMRWSLALPVGPAWTCTLVGGGTLVLARLGIPWNGLTFAALSLVSIAAGLLAGRLLRRRTDAPLGGGVPAAWSRRATLWWCAAIALSIAILWAPTVLGLRPGVPSDLSDPVFHYNGVHAIDQTLNGGSVAGGLDRNYGLRVLPVTYPAVWHALVALVAGPAHVVVPANVMSLLVIPAIFVVGMGALGREVVPQSRPIVAALTPLLATGFTAFPDYLVLGKGFWPNSLAVALLPSLAALAISVLCEVRRRGVLHGVLGWLAGLAVLTACLGGMMITHPSLVFTVGWIGGPVAVLLAIEVARRMRRRWSRRRFTAVCAAVVLALSILAGAVFTDPRVLAALHRPVHGTWQQMPRSVMVAIVNWPLSQNLLILGAFALIYAVGIAMGARVALRDIRSRWLVIAWAMEALLVLGCYLVLPVLSQITGLWYSDAYRLLAIQVVFAAPLLAMAAGSLLERAGNWRPAPPAEQVAARRATGTRSGALRGRRAASLLLRAAVVAAVVAHLGLGALVSRQVAYTPRALGPEKGRYLGSEGELEMIRGLDAHVPAGSLMVGDPLTGVGYVPVMTTHADSVFTQATRRDLDFDGNYLAQHFADIRTDSRVCQIVRHYGIDYYYADAPVIYEGKPRSISFQGLYDVDTSQGFTLVARGGTASVWRIDACGPIDHEEPWWRGYWRRTPLLESNDPPTGGSAGGRAASASEE